MIFLKNYTKNTEIYNSKYKEWSKNIEENQ